MFFIGELSEGLSYWCAGGDRYVYVVGLYDLLLYSAFSFVFLFEFQIIFHFIPKKAGNIF